MRIWRTAKVYLLVSAGLLLGPAGQVEDAQSGGSGSPMIVEVQSCDGSTLDPYEVWKDVTNSEEAEQFLRQKFEEKQSVVKFANWLKCQGFSVSLVHGPLGRLLKEGDVLVDAGFAAAMVKRRPLWYSGFLDYAFGIVWAQTFEVYVHSDGTIYFVNVGQTVE